MGHPPEFFNSYACLRQLRKSLSEAVLLRYTGWRMNDYVESWQEYRKRRNLLLFAFLGYVPIVGIVALITIRLFGSTTPAFILALSWMAFFVFAAIRFQTFRCPRCGKWFFATWWYHNIFARRCVHCSLPKYDKPDQRIG